MLVVYARPLHDGAVAVGLMNRRKQNATVTLELSAIGLPAPGVAVRVRDLVRQRFSMRLEVRLSASRNFHALSRLLARQRGSPCASRLGSQLAGTSMRCQGYLQGREDERRARRVERGER